MRRLTLLVAAATARPDANATEYFDAASRLWPPTGTAGRKWSQRDRRLPDAREALARAIAGLRCV